MFGGKQSTVLNSDFNIVLKSGRYDLVMPEGVGASVSNHKLSVTVEGSAQVSYIQYGNNSNIGYSSSINVVIDGTKGAHVNTIDGRSVNAYVGSTSTIHVAVQNMKDIATIDMSSNSNYAAGTLTLSGDVHVQNALLTNANTDVVLSENCHL